MVIIGYEMENKEGEGGIYLEECLFSFEEVNLII